MGTGSVVDAVLCRCGRSAARARTVELLSEDGRAARSAPRSEREQFDVKFGLAPLSRFIGDAVRAEPFARPLPAYRSPSPDRCRSSEVPSRTLGQRRPALNGGRRLAQHVEHRASGRGDHGARRRASCCRRCRRRSQKPTYLVPDMRGHSKRPARPRHRPPRAQRSPQCPDSTLPCTRRSRSLGRARSRRQSSSAIPKDRSRPRRAFHTSTSPSWPKYRRCASHSVPRRAYGDEAHSNIAPGIVAIDGRNAAMTSASGLARPRRSANDASSSAIAPTNVAPARFGNRPWQLARSPRTTASSSRPSQQKPDVAKRRAR